ncbi:MAG: hypothetical protein EOP04_08715 [Proteobacteria bacterium]|nr:MAG: hypothetical protein EOP04_08715 [Pseudomonadota bacterium]
MLEQYYRIDQAAGVSITTSQDGNIVISCCSIIVKSGQLDFDKKLPEVRSIEELSKYLLPKTVVALNLSGKGILQKQIDRVESLDHNNFSFVLPNANPDDFYVQNFVSGERSFISLVRKAEADKWIQQLTDLGFIPVMLSIGPFPVANIIAQLNIYGSELIFDNHRIRCNEHSEWISYKFDKANIAPFPVKLESEIINEKLVISYAIAFQIVLYAKINPIEAAVPSLESNLQNTLSDKKIKVKGSIILAIFFALLLINFILFSWLNKNNAELTAQVTQSAQSSSNVAGIAEAVKQKELWLRELGWDGGIKKSLLIDQLAATLPANVTWTSVSLNPVNLKSTKEKKVIQFIERTIEIKGTTERIISLNEWLAIVKTKSLVKGAQLEKYTYNNELNTGQFIVKINY